jgi:DNA-binding transcriptional MerR regulator
MRHRHPPVSLETASIPDKLFYKIGEVSRLTGIPAYILRYWETEFDVLQPQKSRSGQRLYRRKDLETILRIKQLLYQEGFTIAGAKHKVRNFADRRESGVDKDRKQEVLRSLRSIKNGLEEIFSILNREG